MGNAGVVTAVLGLIVCIGLAALSVYITITPNSNPEIRAKFAGMVFLLISVGIGVGMVLIISRVPAGTYSMRSGS